MEVIQAILRFQGQVVFQAIKPLKTQRLDIFLWEVH
jgi:hypothetical protein